MTGRGRATCTGAGSAAMASFTWDSTLPPQEPPAEEEKEEEEVAPQKRDPKLHLFSSLAYAARTGADDLEAEIEAMYFNDFFSAASLEYLLRALEGRVLQASPLALKDLAYAEGTSHHVLQLLEPWNNQADDNYEKQRQLRVEKWFQEREAQERVRYRDSGEILHSKRAKIPPNADSTPTFDPDEVAELLEAETKCEEKGTATLQLRFFRMRRDEKSALSCVAVSTRCDENDPGVQRDPHIYRHAKSPIEPSFHLEREMVRAGSWPEDTSQLQTWRDYKPENYPSRARYGLEFVEELNRGDSGTGADHVRDILKKFLRLPQPTTLEDVKSVFRSRDEVMLVVIFTRAVEAALLAARNNGTHPIETCWMMFGGKRRWGGDNDVPLSLMLAFARVLGLTRSHLGPLLEKGFKHVPPPHHYEATIIRLQLSSVRKGGERFAPVVALLMEGLAEVCGTGAVREEVGVVVGIALNALLGLCLEIVTRERDPDDDLVAAAARWRDLIFSTSTESETVQHLNGIWREVVSCCNPRQEKIESDSRLYRRLAPVLQFRECALEKSS